MRVCVSGVAAALTVLLISTPAAAQAPSAARVVRLTGTLPDAIETTAPVLRFAVYDAEAGGLGSPSTSSPTPSATAATTAPARAISARVRTTGWRL